MVVLRPTGPPFTFLPFLVPENVRASKEPSPTCAKGKGRVANKDSFWDAYSWGLAPGHQGPLTHLGSPVVGSQDN